jgi:hypothetical protein
VDSSVDRKELFWMGCPLEVVPNEGAVAAAAGWPSGLTGFLSSSGLIGLTSIEGGGGADEEPLSSIFGNAPGALLAVVGGGGGGGGVACFSFSGVVGTAARPTTGGTVSCFSCSGLTSGGGGGELEEPGKGGGGADEATSVPPGAGTTGLLAGVAESFASSSSVGP